MRRLIQDKPVSMLCSDTERTLAERTLTRFLLAKEFGCLPSELEKVPETDLRKWAGIYGAINEARADSAKSAHRKLKRR